MLRQLESQVAQSLHRGEICSVNHFLNKFSCFKASDIIEVFVNIFKQDKNQNFDLLCHIVIADEEKVRMKMERYSNIQRGVLIENNNSFTTHNFMKEHIKQLKIMAVFPKQLLVNDVQNSLEMPALTKTREYVNKFVLVPKMSVQNTALTKNKSKKQEKKEEKVIEPAKSQTLVEQKKPLKKTQSKSSIEKMQIEQKPSIAPLKKVSSKDTPVNPPPVLTNYAAQRTKVQQQQIEAKVPQNKKLNLDSDEQYFNANPNIFNQQMNIIKQRNNETDHSGKKSEKECQKMEIESQHQKLKKDLKFVVDDEDEDDDFMKQIAEQKKKLTQCERPSPTSTESKQLNKVVPPMAPKPKVQAPKPAPIVAKSQNAPLGANKGALNLKNWLVPKKV